RPSPRSLNQRALRNAPHPQPRPARGRGVARSDDVMRVSAASPASHELNDFELVAVIENNLRPQRFGRDFAVAFDGDPASVDPQRGEEFREGRGIGRIARFSIDDQTHEPSYPGRLRTP